MKIEEIFNFFSEEKQNQIQEILEVLSLAERPANISTKSAEIIFENTRKESLNQAQLLFNDLKESFLDDVKGKGSQQQVKPDKPPFKISMTTPGGPGSI